MEGLVDAYNNGLVTALTCEGCPPGSIVGADRTRRSADRPPAKVDTKMVEKAPIVSIDTWEPCQYPSFLTGQGCPM